MNQEKFDIFMNWYLDNFRFNKDLNLRMVGVEKEYPIVEKNSYEAMDVRGIFPRLHALGWTYIYDDYYTKRVIAVEKDGIQITTDGGECTLEVVFPPKDNLFHLIEMITHIEKLLVKLTSSLGMLILGCGIQPITRESEDLWILKRRHEVIRNRLRNSGREATITASDQVHIDVESNEMLNSTLIGNAFAGPMIRLFANSPILYGGLDLKGRDCSREHFWDFATPDRRGMISNKYKSLEEYLSSQYHLEFLVYKDQSDYINPKMLFSRWIDLGNDLISSWKCHEGAIWHDARPRSMYGTVEFRTACSQLQGQNIVSAAFNLGLVENLEKSVSVMEQYSWDQWRNFKEIAIHGIKDEQLEEIIHTLWCISYDGLLNRCQNEQVIIEPLIDRIENYQNPAKKSILAFQNGGMDSFIQFVAFK